MLPAGPCQNPKLRRAARSRCISLHRGWFIIATCKVHALCRGLARFRPAFRCAGAWRPLPAHPRPNKRDIHVLNEYTVTSGCRPSSSPSGSSRASRTTAPGSSSRRRSNGHLCREGAVAVQWSRRRAGARPPSFRHHPAHARTPQLAHATRLVPEVSPAGQRGSLTLYSLPRACHTRCQAVRMCAAPPLHRPPAVRAMSRLRPPLPPVFAAGLGWYDRRDDTRRGPGRGPL